MMRLMQMMRIMPGATLLVAAWSAPPLAAQTRPEMITGPVFTDFARTAQVDTDFPIPPGTRFKILFDTHDGAEPGALNRTIESAARFINMTVNAGVPRDDIKVAIVVHGKASDDLTRDAVYAARHDGKSNGSAEAIAQLIAQGARIYLCGQSAAGRGIAKSDLLPGVKMALSAMVADALLQQEGYTLNPF